MELIVTCGCDSTDDYAKDAFKILFPGETLPPIAHSAEGVPSQRVVAMVRALERADEKFAYYFRGEEAWDLKKGVRIA